MSDKIVQKLKAQSRGIETLDSQAHKVGWKRVSVDKLCERLGVLVRDTPGPAFGQLCSELCVNRSVTDRSLVRQNCYSQDCLLQIAISSTPAPVSVYLLRG